MPRHCTVCDHPQREKIDELLIEGEPYRSIAKQFLLSDAAVYRHKGEHLSKALIKAREVREVAQADTLLEQVQSLQVKTLDILAKAEVAGDLKTSLGAIREARGNLELLAKLLGELNERPTINILVSPEWLELRTLILETLEPFPQARLALSSTLERFGNGSNSK